MDKRVNPIVSITVNHENCENIEKIFEYLTVECKVNSIKCTIVRDEGVYKTPDNKKQKIFQAYSWLTSKIKETQKKERLNNYNTNSLQGKLHNKKDEISWELIKKMYLKPKYISPCHAGSLFGIVTASGLVYPCEILENKIIGNLREHDMDFMKIWKSSIATKTKDFILKTNCNCSYECALTYNILGNWRYQPSLISSILKF
jgi:MoaA/NifB/PqqE/SkfB family radical SAM enzyme